MRFNPEENLLKKENEKENKKEKKGKVEKLMNITFEKLKELYSNIPIDNTLRIDISNDLINEAVKIWNEENEKNKKNKEKIDILKDNKNVEKLEKKFEKSEGISSGETLEIFKTYLFNKYLSDNLICVRTSKYDDYVNKVDNLLINKENGEIICALDEVADVSSERYNKKFEKVKSANIRNGAIVRYAVTYKENKIIPAINVKGVPLVLFALPEVVLWKAIDELDDIEGNKDYEKNILKHFMRIIEVLISEINLLLESQEKSIEFQVINDRLEKLEQLKQLMDNLINSRANES